MTNRDVLDVLQMELQIDDGEFTVKGADPLLELFRLTMMERSRPEQMEKEYRGPLTVPPETLEEMKREREEFRKNNPIE